jgi:hypothetical protein
MPLDRGEMDFIAITPTNIVMHCDLHLPGDYGFNEP